MAATKGRSGRPSKLTKPLIKKLCKYVQIGMALKDASYAVGINYSTFRSWIVKGENLYASGEETADEDALFLELIEAYKKAESIWKLRCLSVIHRQMPDSWQCAMTCLERKYPDEWGRKDRSDVGALKDEGIKVTIHRVSTPAPVREEPCKADH
jgi:hypothetical protein